MIQMLTEWSAMPFFFGGGGGNLSHLNLESTIIITSLRKRPNTWTTGLAVTIEAHLALVVVQSNKSMDDLDVEAGVLVKAECSRGEQVFQTGIPLCFMPAPGPVLIQHIMSKLLLVAAPIETLIKAIRESSWGGAGGWEDVNSGYIGTDREERNCLKEAHVEFF